LPLRFILTGLVALVSALILILIRPTILSTYHYNQYVIGTTHLVVLGWLSTLVMGAVYQLVPVALETPLFSERLARAQFYLHVIGVAGMVWMFWTWNMTHVGHFGSVFAAGVALFVYNITRTLMRVPRWTVVATGVASSLAWLCLTICLGLAIVAGKCSYEAASSTSVPLLGSTLQVLQAVGKFAARFDQIGLMHAHAHAGVLGIFLMLIVGVSYRLVPMFTLSEVQSERRANLSVLLLNAGLLACLVTIPLRSAWKTAAAGVVVMGLLVYGWEICRILGARKRRPMDWGVRIFLTGVGTFFLLGALAGVLSWPGLPLNAFTGQLENAYGFTALLGAVSLAIIGMLYKIVPFLVWYKAYSRLIGLAKVPSLADLYSPTLQAVGFWIYLTGLVVVLTGILLANDGIVRGGVVLLASSVGLLLINLGRMLRHLIRPAAASPLNVPSRPAPLKTALSTLTS
jgi:hypothetical protein